MIYIRPIAIDLFAGAGGLSLGLEQAGFDVAAAVEYDPVHCAVHSYNFPRTQVICQDVRRLEAGAVRRAVEMGLEAHDRMADWDGEIDLVAGGPPCQGFSLMGRRLEDDARNRLVFEFYRLVLELRPKYFLMENVPGMMPGGRQTPILAELVRQFRAGGYTVVEPLRVVNAADYGVPQDRSRLVILGAREGLPLPEYPRPTVQPRRLRSKMAGPSGLWAGLPVGPSVWDAIGDIPDPGGYAELLSAAQVELEPDVRARQLENASRYAAVLMEEAPDPTDLSNPRTWDRLLLTNSLRTTHAAETIRRFQDTEPGKQEPISRLRRLDPGHISATLRAGTGYERGSFTSPRPIHPESPRVLTVREAARIQSFPDWFRLHQTNWHGFRQIGNAVPPLLARAVASGLTAVLGYEPTRPQRPWPMGPEDLLSLNMTSAAIRLEADRETIPGGWHRRSVA